MVVRPLGATALACGLLLAASAPALAAPDCGARAAAALKRVESKPLKARAPAILEVFAADAALGCGVVPASHWTGPVEVSAACRADPVTCESLPEALPVARTVLEDVDLDTYIRAQTAAGRLKGAGHLSRAHRRLLQLLILSDAVRRER